IRDRNVTGVQTCALPISRAQLRRGRRCLGALGTTRLVSHRRGGERAALLSAGGGPGPSDGGPARSGGVRRSAVRRLAAAVAWLRSEERRVGKGGGCGVGG